jgi:hypothetical protein
MSKDKIKIYKTVNLPVVSYECETWSLTVREERRLMVSENRVLRKIFGPERREVTGSWRKLYKVFHYLYCSLNKHCYDQITEHEINKACNTHGSYMTKHMKFQNIC